MIFSFQLFAKTIFFLFFFNVAEEKNSHPLIAGEEEVNKLHRYTHFLSFGYIVPLESESNVVSEMIWQQAIIVLISGSGLVFKSQSIEQYVQKFRDIDLCVECFFLFEINFLMIHMKS